MLEFPRQKQKTEKSQAHKEQKKKRKKETLHVQHAGQSNNTFLEKTKKQKVNSL